MEQDWLASRLEEGRSIESLARESGRSPSTVAYWVNKHGLTSSHAPKHAARGGLSREQLQPLVEQGLSIRAIAAELSVSAATVRHWLRRHGLRTRPARYSLRGEPKPRAIVRECSLHGWTTFVRVGRARYRCGRCNGEAVSERRRQVKALLVREAGGACVLCGYGRYTGALQFHHVDRSAKSFGLAARGLARSLAAARAEVAKCVLLCANCHAEVEGGVATIPISRPVKSATGSR